MEARPAEYRASWTWHLSFSSALQLQAVFGPKRFNTQFNSLKKSAKAYTRLFIQRFVSVKCCKLRLVGWLDFTRVQGVRPVRVQLLAERTLTIPYQGQWD